MKIRLLFAALAAAAVPFCVSTPAFGTVPTTTTSVTCIASGAPLTCALPFEFLDNSHLVVTLDGVLKTIGTDYTASCAGCTTGGSVTLVVTPSVGQALNIQRVVPYLQLFEPRAGIYRPQGFGSAFDNLEMQIQQIANGITGAGTSFLYPRVGAVLRTVTAKLADEISVQDMGAVADGSLTAATLNNAIQSGKGTLQLPASTSCYNIGANTLVMASGVILSGAGYGSPSAGASCITYTGSGCAVLFDSVRNAGLRNLDVQVNSPSSTAAGVCFKSTTNVSEFNVVENVSITATGTPRVTGQIGLWAEDTGFGVFWNHGNRIWLKGWDVSFFVHSTGSTQGVNSNTFANLFSYAANTGARWLGGNKQATDNELSLTCSRSDASLNGTNITCLLLGDDNAAGVNGNRVFVRADMGSPSVCGNTGTTAGANDIVADCESGGGFADNGVGTFSNRVYNMLGLGSAVGLLSVGNLVTTRGAQIIGSNFFGSTGGGASSSGQTVQIGGGQTGAASQPGGDLQLLGGSGLGQTNGGGGNVLVFPGTRNGTGSGGSVVAGPVPGLTVGSGFKVRSSRVTKFSKVFTISDCAGTNPVPTVSLLLEGSRFSCGTVQNLTLPTAQGASGIVQAMTAATGLPVSVPVAVGDVFEFSMISTAASNFTLTTATGITLLGNAVVNNAKKIWECTVTSVTTNAETLTCY